MAGPFDLETLWNDKHFTVRKGTLNARSRVPGTELGSGVIYYPGLKKVVHLIIDPTDRVVFGETQDTLRCLWNPGLRTEIVNQSIRPADFFTVELSNQPQLRDEFSTIDVATATAGILHGKWPKSFKSSVRADLEAIGLLAQAIAFNKKPSRKEILRAKRAKEDLEFKLTWLNAARHESGGPAYSLLNLSWWGSRGGGSGGGGKKGPPFDGKINVTVNTKDSDGITEIRGYEVWWVANAMEDDASSAHRFPKLSTPTTATLDVGIYSMWIKKAGNAGVHHKIDVGDIYHPRQPDLTLDLTVS